MEPGNAGDAAQAGIFTRGVRRRRFLEIVAGASLAALGGPRQAAAAAPLRWRGLLLGAPTSITIYHDDAQVADQALTAVGREVAGLEAVFSLFQADSALSRLNRDGRLDAAPRALLTLLATSRALHDASHGAFDPTVQVLWNLYERHFASAAADPAGPTPATIQATLGLIGLRHVHCAANRIAFDRPGMRMTFNGIAQGYATDRARAILAAHGLRHCLVNLGEYRALGARPDGGAWRMLVAHPEIPWRSLAELALDDGRALATSAGPGTPFDVQATHHHLFDPRTGHSARGWRSVSVVAADATIADGLSTTLAVAPMDDARAILARFPDCGALLLAPDDTLISLGTGIRPL